MCPVLVEAGLTGTFELRQSKTDPLYTYYDVRDVRWKVPDAVKPITIVGSGTYRRGGEVAITEQLTLDLSFDGGPAQHFDSGLRPPGASFPEIDTRISLHGEFCHDSVLVVDATPDPVTGVGGGPLARSLAATPNPFGASTEITFTLPQEGAVSLGVFDLTGRHVRALVSHQWLAGGPHAHVWDGRLEGGATAPAGLYFVCLDTPSGSTTRRVVKLH
jgi:hypothetical protein